MGKFSCNKAEIFKIKRLKLSVVYFSLCRPHPPVVRALLNAEKFQAAGFKTVRWESEGHIEGWEVVVRPESPSSVTQTLTC